MLDSMTATHDDFIDDEYFLRSIRLRGSLKIKESSVRALLFCVYDGYCCGVTLR